MLKALAQAVLPASAYRKLAFTRIYRKSAWGSDAERFYSGVGSRGKPVEVYVDAVAREIGNPKTIVDCGCGDFVVGRELLKRFPSAKYIGCDIVPDLIRHHQNAYGSSRISFQALDIVADEVPAGDVHLVRQVFQHLCNADIKRAIDKLCMSPCLIVTEGMPLRKTGPVNPDKMAGGDTRFNMFTGEGGGVELDQPPFNKRLTELCRVEMSASEQIITWRVRS
jgi:hypothetical protein